MRGVAALVAALALAGALASAARAEISLRPIDHPNVHATHDAPIEMPGGVTLFADVYRPANAAGDPVPGRFPAVLVQTPYNKNFQQGGSTDPQDPQLDGGSPRLFVRRGYVQVIVDVRGTGSSQGAWDGLGEAEQADSERIARWLVRQPWSDGTFGTWGVSYLGWNQYLMAARRPPGLRALFTIGAGEDAYRDVTWHGGSPNLAFMPFWFGFVSLMKALPPGYGFRDPDEGWELFFDRMGRGSQFSLESGLSSMTEGEFAFDGPFYRLRSSGTVAEKIDVPTFIVGGWWDLFVRGQPRMYEQLRLAPGRKQLLIGPWYHAVSRGRWGNTGHGFGHGLGRPGAPPGLDALAVAWFDRWLKGRDTGVERLGPVTVAEVGTGRWATHPTWPPPEVLYERRYLRPERSGTATSLNDGTLTATPPARASVESGEANQVGGVCGRGLTQWTIGVFPPGTPCESDNRAREATSFTYTTEPQRRPLRLAGPIALRLRGSTTAQDTTWIATLTDVAPDGRSTELTSGWLVASRRALDEQRSVRTRSGDLAVPFHPFTRASLARVVPGAVETYDVEIFPIEATIAPGHRLRLVISSGDVPHILAPMPTLVASAGAVNSVHLDPRDPSFVSLPVVQGGPTGARIAGVGRRADRRRRVGVLLTCPRRERSCDVRVRLSGRRGRAAVRGPATRTTVAPGGRRIVRVRLPRTPRRARRARVVVHATTLVDGRAVDDATWRARLRLRPRR